MTPNHALALLVLGILLVLALAPVSTSHARVAGSSELRPVLSVGAPATVQETSVAEQTQSAEQKFWENVSMAAFGQGRPASFPISLGVPFSYITATQATLYATMSSALTPRIDVTQGATTLANATWAYANQVPAQEGSTNVVEAPVAAYTSTGVNPSAALYYLYANFSTAISFTYNQNISWIQSQTGTWTTNYSFNSPLAATLNSTVVYIPFPNTNVTANASSVVLNFTGTGLRDFQVVVGGIYAILPGIAADKSEWITAYFTGKPTTYGATPVLYFYSYTGDAAGGYTTNTTWFNPSSSPYNGQFLIIGRGLPYPISPTSVKVTYIGKVLKPGFVLVQGDQITLLPGALTVLPQQVVNIFITFQFSGAPPSASASLTSPLISGAGFSFTTGELLIVAGVLVGVWGFVGAVTLKGEKRKTRIYDTLALIVVIMAIALILAVLGAVAPGAT